MWLAAAESKMLENIKMLESSDWKPHSWRQAQLQEVPSNSVIIPQGSPSEIIYVIKRGFVRLVKRIMPVVKKKENRFPDNSQVNLSSLSYYYRIVCTRQGLQTSTARTSYSEKCRPLPFPSSYFLYWWDLQTLLLAFVKIQRDFVPWLICTRPPWWFYLMNVDFTPTRPHQFIFFLYILFSWTPPLVPFRWRHPQVSARRNRRSKNKKKQKQKNEKEMSLRRCKAVT